MKTLLASALLSLSLLLASCGGALAGESLTKTITDNVGKISSAFEGIDSKAAAEKAVTLASSTLPVATKAFNQLKELGTKADAGDAMKQMLTKATGSFESLRTMLGGLLAKFAGKPEILNALKDKIPELLKMLPKMGG